jgi:hypothetical protein
MSSLSPNNIVNPQLVLSAAALVAPDFSVGMVVTHAASLPGGGRVQSFTSSADVAAAFSSDTVLKQFAAMYFGQDEFTPSELLVGVKIDADTDYTAAMAACLNVNPSFYGVAPVSDISTTDQMLMANWCQSNGKRFFGITQEADVLSPASPPTNLLYLIGHNKLGRAMGIYSDVASDAHANIHAAVMGFWLTTVYDQPNSLKTALMAAFTGVDAAAITQTQMDVICGKTDGSAPGWNGNIYAKYGTGLQLMRGQAGDGRFEDEGLALDWLLANVQTDLINCLRKQRVPATDKGSQILLEAPQATLDKAVRNGLLAPGVWNFPGFGALNQGDMVSRGYYGYAAPVTSLSDGDRAARKAPAITWALVGAGALQYVQPSLIFQR